MTIKQQSGGGKMSKTIRLKPGGTFMCECGREHKLTPWVAAHWDISIRHTCECGAIRLMKRGVVELVPRRREKK